LADRSSGTRGSSASRAQLAGPSTYLEFSKRDRHVIGGLAARSGGYPRDRRPRPVAVRADRSLTRPFARL